MIKNHKFLSLFAITLVAALLLSMSGKATSVYALADPVQAVSPIYDTQIYQLKDYIEHGGMTLSQLDIFYTLAGFYVLGQAGSAGYRLVDPYANSDSVWDWLKSCGIEMYNTVIGLIPDTARMPITGDIYSTVPFKKASQLYVATLMGAAVKAATFSSYQDFKDEVTNSQSYYLPWNLDVQKGMNSIFGIYGGIYDWQFDSIPFESNLTWDIRNYNAASVAFIENSLKQYSDTLIKVNYGNTGSNLSCLQVTLDQEYSLFVNQTTGEIYVVDVHGNHVSSVTFSHWGFIRNGGTYVDESGGMNSAIFTTPLTCAVQAYNTNLTVLQQVQTYLDNSYAIHSYRDMCIIPSTMIKHVYAGFNWLDKHEVFNLRDLNIDDSDQQYYVAPPSETDYLIDIKGILNDLLNELDLTNIFLNNLIDINGVPVHDDDLIRITTNIYDLLEQTNPVMPVNLNDISDYTSNHYLDLVKHHGQNFGETIGEYVAFWHNSDPEITYVIFGALILTLIGTFVGKWGHS